MMLPRHMLRSTAYDLADALEVVPGTGGIFVCHADFSGAAYRRCQAREK